MAQPPKSRMLAHARKPQTSPLELIRFGHSNHEFNASKYFGTATPFPLNLTSTPSRLLLPPTHDKLYKYLSPTSTPTPIKHYCAICNLHQIKHFRSSASSKRLVPVASVPVFMLKGDVSFHEACLFAYLLADSKVPRLRLTENAHEELRGLKEWVCGQKWDWFVLEGALDRVLKKGEDKEVGRLLG
jgi:hypothetical protein